MHKMLFASVACLALLVGSAQAKDDDHHGGPAVHNQMTQAGPNNAAGNGSGHHHDGKPGQAGGQGWNSGGQNAGNGSNGNTWSGRPGNGNGNNRPGNAWSGSNRPGNAGWHGNNWRNDRAYWNRYHRSWTATRRYRWTAPYVRPAGWYYRRWTLGAFLPALFFAQQYWINNYAMFTLDPPPPGTIWVRYGNDALLVDRNSGEVIQVVYGIFY